MCLYTTQLKPRVAKSDITCYKVLTKDLVSPCYNQQYVLGEKIESVLNHFRNTITKGLHTFVYLEQACYEARNTCWRNQRNPDLSDRAPIVVKCIIPQGTLYYSSRYFSSPSALEYASEQLIPLELVYDATEYICN
jgi:hypothetical protein